MVELIVMKQLYSELYDVYHRENYGDLVFCGVTVAPGKDSLDDIVGIYENTTGLKAGEQVRIIEYTPVMMFMPNREDT